MERYRNGADANSILESRRILSFPYMSDNEPAGQLISMPGIVEAAATTPRRGRGVPKLFAKGFKTGFFDIVELNMANKPTTHRILKKASSTSTSRVSIT